MILTILKSVTSVLKTADGLAHRIDRHTKYPPLNWICDLWEWWITHERPSESFVERGSRRGEASSQE